MKCLAQWWKLCADWAHSKAELLQLRLHCKLCLQSAIAGLGLGSNLKCCFYYRVGRFKFNSLKLRLRRQRAKRIKNKKRRVVNLKGSSIGSGLSRVLKTVFRAVSSSLHNKCHKKKRREMEKRRQWRGGVCKTVLRLSVAFIRATKSSKIALIARRQAKKSLKSEEKRKRGGGCGISAWKLNFRLG